MKRDDRIYLQHMLDAISTIETYLAGSMKLRFAHSD